ncbi:NAD-dependent epimerase/dehydratase family protein [bacterium]|nr:NAD-dependent epimerase/dehydratase family protein [bacterium]
MKVVVFGASGKVGRQIVRRLLDKEQSVVAFVHTKNPFADNPSLRVIRGDIYRPQNVDNALKGADVVVSVLGSWGTKKQDVVSSGIKNIITAMENHKINRIISLTGIAFWEEDNPSFANKLTHSLLKLGAPKILKDGEDHIELLRNSGLDWTVIRSPVMTSSRSSDYKLVDKLAGLFATIPRSAVARAIIEQIKSSEYINKAPVIRRN